MLNNIIQKEHELVCSGCGCVLGQVDEIPIEITSTIKMSPNTQLLGSALVRNVKNAYPRSMEQMYQERTLQRLADLVKRFGIPEIFAIDTFNVLRKKNRGFRSEKEPIKQLIKILSKDENYIHFHKMNALKSYLKQLEDDLKG